MAWCYSREPPARMRTSGAPREETEGRVPGEDCHDGEGANIGKPFIRNPGNHFRGSRRPALTPCPFSQCAERGGRSPHQRESGTLHPDFVSVPGALPADEACALATRGWPRRRRRESESSHGRSGGTPRHRDVHRRAPDAFEMQPRRRRLMTPVVAAAARGRLDALRA